MLSGIGIITKNPNIQVKPSKNIYYFNLLVEKDHYKKELTTYKYSSRNEFTHFEFSFRNHRTCSFLIDSANDHKK